MRQVNCRKLMKAAEMAGGGCVVECGWISYVFAEELGTRGRPFHAEEEASFEPRWSTAGAR